MKKSLICSVGAALITFSAGAAPSLCRADQIYTFEAPQFTLGETTPILNRAPNSGSPTFATSFVDATTANGFSISNTATFQPNNLMAAQYLFEATATDALTLTFNTPVVGLSVDFAIDVPNGSPAGLLKLVTSSGGTNQTGSNVGGTFQGGTLTFSTATPFTTATLQGFQNDGITPTQIAIDNLNLTIRPSVSSVPEPASVAMLSLGVLGLLGYRLRKRAT